MTRVPTRTVDQRDDYFGTGVADPYRWLEDTSDPEVVDWLRAQAADTRGYLDALPAREAISAAVGRAVRLPHSGLPVHRGPYWFRTANDGRQQQDVLLVSDTPFGAGRVLIDPNQLSPDASISLAAMRPSPDGTLVAYSYMESGSDWRTWRVRDVESGTDLPDVVEWSKFTVPSWLPDGSGFVHGCFDAPQGDEYISSNSGQRIELHRLGTAQAEDELVLALPGEQDITFWPWITEDGRWLVLLGNKGTESAARVWIRDLGDPSGALGPLLERAEARWQPLGTSGDELLMITDLDAPRGRVVALHTADGSVREIVAERADTLADGAAAGGRLVLHWLRDASSRMSVHALDGSDLGDVPLPPLGSVVELAARESEPIVHIGTTSFTEPPSVLAYNVATGQLSRPFAAQLDSDVVTEQIWVTSKDSTQVPIFLLHRPRMSAAGGPYPAWLYGYGGFRAATTPAFEPTRHAFAAAGGVVAVACLRGGGEYGAAWHDAGRLANKQNVFDDAIATAEHLIATGWTTARHLGLSGRSNGGLLAGAVLTQRPDLFAAVVPEVGVLDMLRFGLWTIGWAWISDYGDPQTDEAQFRTAYAYSPLHNLRDGMDYPAVLVLTSDHDDRVVPAHSMKFAARLQAVSPDSAVALLRVEASGGHREGRSHDALIAERTDVLAFLSQHTGLSWR